uniref:Uncharacterized protein n=1 Tax=Euplotes harpa TaxID=151035 RepID=A0A7S3JLE0_9SPIT|mmetsp:Transcript_7143/g.8119  ORF Transcript_7143/g.8119 Transcript_7143/m.8119 type:complete len:227 (+) Transcript_7143:24-704(+)
MKLVLFIVIAIAFTAHSMSLMTDKNDDLFQGAKNFELTIDTTVNGLNLIASEIISTEFNKIKVQYTTFNGDVPAFDIVQDFTKGEMLQYFNLTGECKVYQIEKMCLHHYLHNLIANHTEFAGRRGENLSVYEIKHPEETGSRTWLYGMWFHEHGKSVFVPTRFQSHHPQSKQDYEGEFIDRIGFPHVSNSTFDYPACNGVAAEKLDFPFSLSLLGPSLNVIKSIQN